MPWALPGSATTGNPIPASWGNNVNGDLTILQNQVGLLAHDTAITGSPPSATTPAFYIICGLQNVNFPAGSGTLTFPTAFPGGLLAFTATPETASPASVTLSWASPFASQISLYAQNAGVNVTGNLTVSYIAIGF